MVVGKRAGEGERDPDYVVIFVRSSEAPFLLMLLPDARTGRHSAELMTIHGRSDSLIIPPFESDILRVATKLVTGVYFRIRQTIPTSGSESGQHPWHN